MNVLGGGRGWGWCLCQKGRGNNSYTQKHVTRCRACSQLQDNSRRLSLVLSHPTERKAEVWWGEKKGKQFNWCEKGTARTQPQACPVQARGSFC